MSSNAPVDGMGSETALKRMLSRENVKAVWFNSIVNNDSGWRSREEDSPWIQIELEKKMLITGIQLECYTTQERCKPLCIWVSDDGVHEREVFKEERGIRLYRANLQNKNISAKYIRIGRASGVRKDNFRLNKILIYGKK